MAASEKCNRVIIEIVAADGKNMNHRWFENPNNVGLPSVLKDFRPLALPENQSCIKTSRRKITCLIQTQKNIVTCFNICRISNYDRSHSIISLKPSNNIIVLQCIKWSKSEEIASVPDHLVKLKCFITRNLARFL